jgi:hypothetical protein
MAKPGVHLNVYRVGPSTWRCDIKLNASEAGGGLTARGTADTKMGFSLHHAIGGALTLARHAIANPAIIAAFPELTLPALAVVQALKNATQKDVLDKVRERATDPTLRKAARELHEMNNGKRTAMSGGGICICDGAKRPRKNAQHPMMGSPAFGLSAERGQGRGPFGLPEGNPHPFAAQIARMLQMQAQLDPLMAQKLERMNNYQRGMARASR